MSANKEYKIKQQKLIVKNVAYRHWPAELSTVAETENYQQELQLNEQEMFDTVAD
jgi:hypothetical protein